MTNESTESRKITKGKRKLTITLNNNNFVNC